MYEGDLSSTSDTEVFETSGVALTIKVVVRMWSSRIVASFAASAEK